MLKPRRVVGIHFADDLLDLLDASAGIIAAIAHDHRRGGFFVGDHAVADIVRSLALRSRGNDAEADARRNDPKRRLDLAQGSGLPLSELRENIADNSLSTCETSHDLSKAGVV